LFSSGILIDKADYEFETTTAGWALGKSPAAPTNYVVELLGAKTETVVTIDKYTNLQFLTSDSKTSRWELG